MDGSRRSLACDGLGLPAEDALRLSEHDREFFCDQSAAVEWADDPDFGSPAALETALPENSDDEENLDSPEAIPAAAATAGTAGKRKAREFVPTTLAAVQEQIVQGCKCRNKNCYASLTPEQLLTIKTMTEAEERENLEVFLCGKLDAIVRRGAVSHNPSAGEELQDTRTRASYDYAVSGVRVCQEVFLYANSCTRHMLQKVEAHLTAGCMTSPPHAGTGSLPWNALVGDEADGAVKFIRNFAEVNGLPQPAAPRGHNTAAPTYLPCFVTKKMLHAEYMKSGGAMSYSTFTRIWKSKCPDIVIMKPREDVCGKCSDLQSRITRAITEEERADTVEQLRSHITKAIDSRDEYREFISTAKVSLSVAEGEVPEYTHLTFDFAQQATIPHHARQVGPLYFRVPRRIQIFGISNEAVPKQMDYLIDEHQTIGRDATKAHGPNAVISMLHHHLEKHTPPSPRLGLHADNCCGQNKNRSVMAYLAWRVLVGLNKTIQIDFMRVGHTRCFVDAGFGLLKQKFRKGDVDTVEQLVEVINDSAIINQAETFCWEWRSWDNFFAQHFRPVKSITSFQRFVFHHESPGVVQMSCSDTLQDKSLQLLMAPANSGQFSKTALPTVLPPGGMSHERALYLFKNIRQFCHAESRDITCPEPAQPAPEAAE